MKYLLILVMSVFVSTALANPEWMAKPVQCGDQSEVETLLERDNQKPLIAALAKVAYDDGNGSFSMAEKPVILFYNPNENMYSFIEFNPEINQACVISFGGNLDFNVADWYYGDKNS